MDLTFFFCLLRCKEPDNKLCYNCEWNQESGTNIWQIYTPFKSKKRNEKNKSTLKNHKNTTSPTNCTKTQTSQHVHWYYFFQQNYLPNEKTDRVDFFSVTRHTSRSTTKITNLLSSYKTKYQTRGLKNLMLVVTMVLISSHLNIS